MQLTETITAIIRAYPAWSPTERRHMHAITEEILAHLRDGTGNPFIVQWCTRYLLPRLSQRQEGL